MIRAVSHQPRKTTSFWRFYRRVGLDSLKILWRTAKSIEGIGAVVGFLLLFFNRQLGSAIMNWDGISRYWAGLPLLIWFMISLMRAIHREFVAIEVERDDALAEVEVLREQHSGGDSRRIDIKARLEQLADDLRRCRHLRDAQAMVELAQQAESFIQRALGRKAATDFRVESGYPRGNPRRLKNDGAVASCAATCAVCLEALAAEWSSFVVEPAFTSSPTGPVPPASAP